MNESRPRGDSIGACTSRWILSLCRRRHRRRRLANRPAPV